MQVEATTIEELRGEVIAKIRKIPNTDSVFTLIVEDDTMTDTTKTVPVSF